MVDRFREWGFFTAMNAAHKSVSYDGWEINPVTAARAATRVRETEAFEHGEVHVGDVRSEEGRTFDLLTANAVLDLFPPETSAEWIAPLVEPGGLLYASIVFDGVTIVQPTIDARIDDEVLRLYHRSMAQGFARHHLFGLFGAGFELLQLGSSDWIIPPRRGGPLPEEREVVSTVLAMMEASVGREIVERGGTTLTTADLSTWLQTRRRQLERGELLFEAHQMDLLRGDDVCDGLPQVESSSRIGCRCRRVRISLRSGTHSRRWCPRRVDGRCVGRPVRGGRPSA